MMLTVDYLGHEKRVRCPFESSSKKVVELRVALRYDQSMREEQCKENFCPLLSERNNKNNKNL